MLVVGIPTDIIDTPVFGREVPVRAWELPVLLATALLTALWFGIDKPARVERIRQTADVAAELVILNQRQMRAKDGFTLAVALAQLLIELFGKRRQTMLQPGIVFRTRRNLTITFQVITLPKRERTCSHAPCQHAAVQQVRVEANQRTRQRVRRQFRRGRLNAIAVNKPVQEVLLQRSSGLFFIATGDG